MVARRSAAKQTEVEVNDHPQVHVVDPLEVAKAVADKNLPVSVLGLNIPALRQWAKDNHCPDGQIFGLLVERK